MSNWTPGNGPPPGGYGPPPGGYGAPPAAPNAHNPYAAPQAPYGVPQPGVVAPPAVEGSVGLGFCAGFFGGCIGLILVYAIAKGPATKRGAGIGFAVQMAVGLAIRVLAAASN